MISQLNEERKNLKILEAEALGERRPLERHHQLLLPRQNHPECRTNLTKGNTTPYLNTILTLHYIRRTGLTAGFGSLGFYGWVLGFGGLMVGFLNLGVSWLGFEVWAVPFASRPRQTSRVERLKVKVEPLLP